MNWLRGLPAGPEYRDHWGLCEGSSYDGEPKAQVWFSLAERRWYYACEDHIRKDCDSLEDGMRRADKALGRATSEADLLFT